MNHPNIVPKLHRIDDPERVTPVGQRDFKDTEPRPFIGFAMSALAPSAAMVSAARQIDCASSGNFAKSLRAALIQLIGRVVLVIHTLVQCCQI